MGVWIEIFQRYARSTVRYVTPFMGVWIEIILPYQTCHSFPVTPFMGVWIEIALFLNIQAYQHRHTLYGCVD